MSATSVRSKSNLTQTERNVVRIMAELEEMLGELVVNEQRSELIRELDAAILRSTFSPQEVLDLIVEKCLSRTDSQHGQVVLYKHNSLEVAASSEPSRVGEELPLHHSLCGKAVLDRAEQHYPDVSVIPPDSYFRYHDATRSELVVLIQSSNVSRVLGVLDLERDTLGHFPPKAIDFAKLLAGQAAIAIQHARTWSGVKTLYDLSTALVAGTVTLEQSCQTILNALLENFDFEHGQILRREGNEFVIIASSRREDIGLRPGRDSSLCGHYLLAEGKRSILAINDIEQSEYKDLYLALLGAEDKPMRSEMIIPLVDDSARLTGALNIESPQVGIFSDFDVSLFGVVGRLLAGAISATLTSRKRAKEEQIKAADLAMTHLGNVAQSFLHRFGNKIGDARGRMLELKQHLEGQDLPGLRREMLSVGDFIGDIVESLGEARVVVDDFSNQFDPRLIDFQFRDIDLAAVGSELLDKYKQKYAGTGINFCFSNQLPSVDKNGQLTVGSRAVCRLTEKIYDVVENLLDNAVRAVVERPVADEPGEIAVIISLSNALSACLRVRDNGIGIDAADRRRIFEFGYSTRKSGGTSLGIGLWFCEHYTLQLGGKIAFDSKRGKGSWFEIEFPTIAIETEA